MKWILAIIFIFSVVANFLVVNVNKGLKKIIDDKVIIYNNDTIKNYSYLKHPGKNQLFIVVKVNGKKAYFLLDTGATLTVLDKNQLDSYKLTCFETGEEFGGIGGANILYQVNGYDSLVISGVKYDQKLYASDIRDVVDGTSNISHIHILGILGSDFFSEHGVVFDYDKEIFFVRK